MFNGLFKLRFVFGIFGFGHFRLNLGFKVDEHHMVFIIFVYARSILVVCLFMLCFCMVVDR